VTPAGPADWVSIDPGLQTGWAAWCGGKLLACGLGDPPLARLRCAIELPQVYPRSPVPPNDLITLAYQAGRYVGRYAGGVEITTVYPHQWKGQLPKAVCAARVRAALLPKRGEPAVLEGALASVATSRQHNVLDAVGIGLAVFRGVKL
jgi:hypothetical protein